MSIRIRNWLFKHLFPQEWDHMGHLVDDVIRLEQQNALLRVVPPQVHNTLYQIDNNVSQNKTLWMEIKS